MDMTGSEISQGSREQVETDADEIEREGIARVIYVVPVAMAVERGAQAGEAESTVELRNGGLTRRAGSLDEWRGDASGVRGG